MTRKSNKMQLDEFLTIVGASKLYELEGPEALAAVQQNWYALHYVKKCAFEVDTE